MLIWSLVLFALGVLAFLDAQFNYGYLFRTANSAMFMLVSLGLLIRIWKLAKLGFKERLIENNDNLRARMVDTRRIKIPVDDKKPAKEIASKKP